MALFDQPTQDSDYILQLLERARGSAPKKSLWSKATQPVKALFGVTGNVGGQVAGALAPDLYAEALKRNLEQKAAASGTTVEGLSDLEAAEALPGLGDVITSAAAFQESAPGRVAGHVVGLAGNILGDPTSYLGGAGAISKIAAIRKIGAGAGAAETLAKAGLKAESLTGRAAAAAGQALSEGRTGAAIAKSLPALADVPFGPAAALVYGPEMVQGVTAPAKEAFSQLSQGNIGPAVEEMAKSAIAATMASLVAKGLYTDAQAAHLIREYHTPPQVAPTPAAVPPTAGIAPPATPAPLVEPIQPPTAGTPPAMRSEGSALQAIAEPAVATAGPTVGQALGGVNTQSKLDATPLPGAELPPPVSPLTQDAIPAQPAPLQQAIPEAVRVEPPPTPPTAPEATPAPVEKPFPTFKDWAEERGRKGPIKTTDPDYPDLLAMYRMERGEGAGPQPEKGDADLQAYLTAKTTGLEASQDTYRGRNSAGKELGLNLGAKAAKRISDAVKEAKEAGSAEGLSPLAKSIFEDIHSGEMRVPEAPRMEGRLREHLQDATQTPQEPLQTADISGRVGSPVLGAQTASERAETLPIAEASQRAAEDAASEKAAQWTREMKERGSVLAPEELAKLTPSQQRALTTLHSGEPGRTPVDAFLARIRRSMSDQDAAQRLEVHAQNELEKSLLSISRDKDAIQDFMERHPGATPQQAVTGLLGKQFSRLMKGKLKGSRAGVESSKVGSIAAALEGADPEQRSKFLTDHRINETVLAESAQGIEGGYDFLDRVMRKVRVDGAEPPQWMLDAVVEIGPPPSRSTTGPATATTYNKRLQDYLDAEGVKIPLAKAQNALQRVSDAVGNAVSLERGRRAKRSMSRSPEDVREQGEIVAAAAGRLQAPKLDKPSLDAIADLAQVASRLNTLDVSNVERGRIAKSIGLQQQVERLVQATKADVTPSASVLVKLQSVVRALGGTEGDLASVLKERSSRERLLHRALDDPNRLPWEGEKWDGLMTHPTDRLQFRYSSGKANLYGRLIRSDVREPFALAVMPEDGKGHLSSKSIPAVEALAAEALKHGQDELFINWDWFGSSKERFEALKDLDPDSPVRLSELPSRDTEYARFRIEAGTEPPPRPEGGLLKRLSERAEKARADQAALLKQVGGTASMGADPTLLARWVSNQAIIAADAIAKGGVRFAEWAQTLPAELRVHAKEIWAKAQEHLRSRELQATGTEGTTSAVPSTPSQRPQEAPADAGEAVAQAVADAAPLPPRKAIRPIPGFAPQKVATEALPRPSVAIPETKPGAKLPGEDSYLNTFRNVLPRKVLEDGVQLGKVLTKHLDRSKKQTHAEVVEEALSRFGRDDPEEFVARVQRAGGAKSAAEVTQLRLIHNRYLADHSKAKDAFFEAVGSEDPERIARAQQKLIEQATATSMVSVVAANDATNTARMLRARGILLGAADPKGMKLNKLRKGLERLLTSDGMDSKKAEEVADLLTKQYEKGNYAEILEAVKNHKKVGAQDKILEAYKANMIGPPSWLAAGISNTLFEGIRNAETVLAAGVDKLLTLTGVQKQREFVLPGLGMLAAAKKAALSEGWNQFRHDMHDIMRLEGLELKPEDFLTASDREFYTMRGAIEGKKGEFIRTPFKVMSALDRYGKTQAKHREMALEAYNAAIKQGLSGEELRKATETNYIELGKALDFHHPDHSEALSKWKQSVDRIYSEMDTDTFQAPMEEGTLLSGMQRMLQKQKLLTAPIVPFYSTPANVFLETVRRTPLGFLTAIQRAKKNGTPLGKELAKPLMGSALMAMLYGIAEGGDLTGGGPLDPEQKEALKSTGWQPYSFKIGDEFVSYQRLEPISSLLGLAADAAEGARRGDFSKLSTTLERGSEILAENLTNKTFMQGIEGFFSAYSDPARHGERFLKGLVGSVVPNVVGVVPVGIAARALDPTYRQTTLLTAPLAKVPGLSEDLPAQTTPTGEDRQRPGTVLERLLSPFSRSTAKKTAAARVAAEMDRIGFPIRPPRRFENIGGLRVEYSREEYEQLRQAQMEATEKMSRLLKDPTYQRLPDNELDPRYRLDSKTKEDVMRRVYAQALRPIRARLEPRMRKQALQLMKQRERQVPALGAEV